MIYLLPMVFIMSLAFTAYIRHYALAKNILDIPNHRSSHQIPTPRGGGLAFIITLFLTLPFMLYWQMVAFPIALAFLGGGLLVAILGFWDDHGHVPVYVRLLGHFTAAFFVLYCLGGMPYLVPFIPVGWVLNVLGFFYLVWLVNLYNFMDGIDGIAGIQMITVCLSGAFLYWLHGAYALMSLPLVVASASAGFLWWNFPKARIFMGDAGSGFLGLILGVLTIQAGQLQAQLFWAWVIFLGVFIVDATLTLSIRLIQGCKIYEAHDHHAYQHAAQYFGNHLTVTRSVCFINLFWLFPIGILVAQSLVSVTTGLTVAYLPLSILALVLKAGRNNK
jgi:Fuc2NAc and GlcNAc transferase